MLVAILTMWASTIAYTTVAIAQATKTFLSLQASMTQALLSSQNEPPTSQMEGIDDLDVWYYTRGCVSSVALTLNVSPLFHFAYQFHRPRSLYSLRLETPSYGGARGYSGPLIEY